MGRGDKRSRRGKIFAGSFGKTRPKNKKSGAPAKQEEKGEVKDKE
jgi:30S ribosomal protein S31